LQDGNNNDALGNPISCQDAGTEYLILNQGSRKILLDGEIRGGNNALADHFCKPFTLFAPEMFQAPVINEHMTGVILTA